MGYIISVLDGNERGALSRFEFLFEPCDIFSYSDIFLRRCRFVVVSFIRLCIDSQPSEIKNALENAKVISPLIDEMRSDEKNIKNSFAMFINRDILQCIIES